MWRVTGVFLFMCGALTAHLAQQDWSVLVGAWPTSTPAVAAVAAADTPQPTPVQPPTIEERVANMTTEEKVGQLLMVGHWKGDYYQHTQRLIDLYNLGGIIIMDVEKGDVTGLSTWTSAWQDASSIPLLISIDQEGGTVSRIQADGYVQTSQRELQTTNEAYTVGNTRGRELAALGINTNLAPVLDYASTSDAFLYDRSFASSTTLGDLATALITGHTDAGVLAIPKHFPGHDSTPADSHVTLPVVDISAARFPAYVSQFREVLDQNDIGAMMTAHVQFPRLDDRYPTTLSEEILSRQLRRELDFDGVIITDDMTMGAITNTWTTNAAALRTIQAGADMMLFAAQPNAAIDAHEHLVQAVRDGTIEEDRLDQSVARILQLKQDQGLLD